MLFLYFVRSLKLRFPNKRYFGAKLLGKMARQKYITKQHYKQR